MNRKRILFVDDEPHLLDGLRNLLRKQRTHWDMTFALGGQHALAAFRRAPFDVIVSDMRMPGMDGAVLLQKIKEEYPSVARIVLSGHAEREAVVRALPVAHQYLSKPCDADLLRAVIERTCHLQALLHDEAIRDVVSKLDKLPSVPRSFGALMRAVTRDDVGLPQVARIIEEDPAMSAKVLQLTNSACFGLGQRVTSIQQSVAYLGVDVLRGLVLTTHVFAEMDTVSVPGFSLDQFQRSSLLTARLARRLVSSPARGDEAFATGMVHDIGKLILALGLPDRFSGVVRVSQNTGRPLHDVEQELLGVTHAEVGAYLLGVWGLPCSMVEAVAFHHTPGLVTAGDREALAAVHIADALIDVACAEECGRPVIDAFDVGFVESMGRVLELPAWRAMAREEVRSAAADAGSS
jgi:HD-like signal output (HDOD) protein